MSNKTIRAIDKYKENERVLRQGFRNLLGDQYNPNYHICRLMGMTEALFGKLNKKGDQ